MSPGDPDVFHRWIAPIGLVAMLMVALVLALLLVRHHGRMEQWRLVRKERKHPFAAPTRTTLSFGVAALAVLAFTRIARQVVEGETHRFDVNVAMAVHRLDSEAMDVIMKVVTWLGSPVAVIPIALVVLGWSYRRKDYRAMLALVVVLVMTELLNVALKDTFLRARPTLWEKIARLDSSSFPSGHSMGAAAGYGMLAIVLTRLAPRHRRLFEIAAPICVLLIGLSRIYLGVHWPTDVLAGFAAGGFLVLAGAVTLDGLPVQRSSTATHEEPA